jgi:RNA polymerase sigma-70 factor (ECF subfamily)
MGPEDQRWIDGLAAGSPNYERTCRELHSFLVRAARREMTRRIGIMSLSGPERDDIACQVASDALLLIVDKAGEFRGESRFTTWAAGFAAFQVKSKLRQYLSQQDRLAAPPEQWDLLLDPAPGPEHEAEARDLVRAVKHIMAVRLTRVQRAAFTRVILSGDTPEAVAASLGTNANAVYQAIFRARRKLRLGLAADGFVA